MAVLSNGDLESLNRAISGLGIPVDRAISAEQAGFYKTHSGVYRLQLARLVCPAIKCYTWQPMPGISGVPGRQAWPGAYINRYSIPYVDADGSQADLEVSNLAGLADRLTQLQAPIS